MNCPFAAAPNDAELVSAAFDGESLPAAARAHLEQCTICQQRLAVYKRINTLLCARLYRSQCPRATELNYYCAGMLPPDDAITIAHHLRDCPLCAQEVEEVRSILANFDPSFMPAVTLPLYRTPFRIRASLVPWQPAAPGGDESNTLAISAWPRRYRAERLHISIYLSRSGAEKFMLLAALSSAGGCSGALEGCCVDLFCESERSSLEPSHENGAVPLMSGCIDARDTIVFSALPAGTYTMIVHMPASDIIIPALAIERG